MPTSAALQSRAAYPCPPAIIAERRSQAGPVARAGAEDADRDFLARRQLATRAGRRDPLERVAAFLVAISRNNSYEGRDPRAVPDSLTSGFVAELLGLKLTCLADVLVELQELGVIAVTPASGLRLIDLAGLERLAEAA